MTNIAGAWATCWKLLGDWRDAN